MPPKYEYKTVAFGGKEVYQKEGHDEYMTILNSCGKDGWELVSAYCWSVAGKNEHQYYFKRELQEEPQVDETEVNTDEILSGMNKLKVDTEPPAPPRCASNSYFEKPPGVFTIGTPDPPHKSSTFRRAVRPTPTFEKPPGEKSTAEDAGTEVDILRRDLDDLRNDFDKVRRKLGKTLGIGFITKEEEFEDIKRPSDFSELSRHRQYPPSFKGMTNKEYRAWKSDFEKNYREQQKQREKETEGDEEQQIAKDRLEAELQRVIKVEREAENKAKLKAYSEAEVDAKAQKKHYSETGEFISKGE